MAGVSSGVDVWLAAGAGSACAEAIVALAAVAMASIFTSGLLCCGPAVCCGLAARIRLQDNSRPMMGSQKNHFFKRVIFTP